MERPPTSQAQSGRTSARSGVIDMSLSNSHAGACVGSVTGVSLPFVVDSKAAYKMLVHFGSRAPIFQNVLKSDFRSGDSVDLGVIGNRVPGAGRRWTGRRQAQPVPPLSADCVFHAVMRFLRKPPSRHRACTRTGCHPAASGASPQPSAGREPSLRASCPASAQPARPMP